MRRPDRPREDSSSADFVALYIPPHSGYPDPHEDSSILDFSTAAALGNTGIYPWVMRGKMLTPQTFSTALPVVSTRTSSTGSSEKPPIYTGEVCVD
jgi:hypothetical protein